MAKLADLGFSTDIISETIVSTYNSDGTSNAAPMGVIMKDSNHVIINIFASALTHQNLSIKKNLLNWGVQRLSLKTYLYRVWATQLPGLVLFPKQNKK